ncbi:MAG: hypothetical protein MUE74_04435 [Bacteroidales bacterium]|jgi:hypothetical protein|nr:hypothetical protein [Bacteroidales bacterium]
MKKTTVFRLFPVITFVISALALHSCKDDDNPIKFPYGVVPDTVTVNIEDLNSVYNDYNMDIHQLFTSTILIFSSDRGSMGAHFDLIQGGLEFLWDQTTGGFGYNAGVTSDSFIQTLLNTANTDGDDFGPYRFFSTVDGYEYMLVSSENGPEGLDFYYLKNQPIISSMPVIHGPYPATLLNTSYNDAYISFDLNQDTAFFSSDRDGDFDIYAMERPAQMTIENWLNSPLSDATPVESLNSAYADKCPFAYKTIIVFASDRPGGMGGFDLYYSTYSNGTWSSPENFGPNVNTPSNEYRPVLAMLPNYTNHILLFSSDRTGGKGGYDLYFRGITFED